MKPINILPFGERAVLLEWDAAIALPIHRAVVETDAFLKEHFAAMIAETVYGYCSLAVYLHKKADTPSFIKQVKQSTFFSEQKGAGKYRKITLPVCYEAPFACDLEAVAKYHKLSVKEVVALHTQADYYVYFIGFLPGFPYLGGLSKRLHTPRKETPRKKIEQGAVGIGGGQTGIYPSASPGGWNIIGRTPVVLFDVANKHPSLLNPGDMVCFRAVSTEELQHIQSEVAQHTYIIEEEVKDA